MVQSTRKAIFQQMVQYLFDDSNKKRKDILETRAVLVESLYCLEIYQAAQNTGDHF